MNDAVYEKKDALLATMIAAITANIVAGCPATRMTSSIDCDSEVEAASLEALLVRTCPPMPKRCRSLVIRSGKRVSIVAEIFP